MPWRLIPLEGCLLSQSRIEREMSGWIGHPGSRVRLSQTRRRAVFLYHGDRRGVTHCAGCGLMLVLYRPREWEVDHKKGRWKGGEDNLENYQVLCVLCHGRKTIEEAKIRSKADRTGNKHMTGRIAKNPLPAGRKSTIKKTLKGKVTKR